MTVSSSHDCASFPSHLGSWRRCSGVEEDWCGSSSFQAADESLQWNPLHVHDSHCFDQRRSINWRLELQLNLNKCFLILPWQGNLFLLSRYKREQIRTFLLENSRFEGKKKQPHCDMICSNILLKNDLWEYQLQKQSNRSAAEKHPTTKANSSAPLWNNGSNLLPVWSAATGGAGLKCKGSLSFPTSAVNI